MVDAGRARAAGGRPQRRGGPGGGRGAGPRCAEPAVEVAGARGGVGERPARGGRRAHHGDPARV
ncbi:MAG: hypothetical protein B9S34_15645 [Opitutia bacterium Tous-C1TDCM]|nr:MAG: hypothetical protein B9S34_15645 [Opitutae bacterium Tous-C1TDCM]